MGIPVLDRRVSQEKFRQAEAELRSVQETYSRVWQIASCKYPVMGIYIMSGSSAPCLGLSLNMKNWDLWPPQALYASSDLRRCLSSAEIPAFLDDPAEPVSHIVDDGLGRAWPCSPGFHQYHILYSEDSWQVIRGTGSGAITWIVERACDMVDREGLRGPIV